MAGIAKTILLVLSICVLTTLAGRDFYKILGVSKNATPKDIKKAYRQMSVKYHPDKNPSVEARETYKEVNDANEVRPPS
jgi:DnaJ-class molecular chaperone